MEGSFYFGRGFLELLGHFEPKHGHKDQDEDQDELGDPYLNLGQRYSFGTWRDFIILLTCTSTA